MTKELLSDLSLQQLAYRFEALCLEQYSSIEREEFVAYGHRYKQIWAVIDELKSRPGDQRRLLQRFFSHRNNQVRITAAHANLAIDYDRARAVFQDVADNDFGAQKLDAGMTLSNHDRGIYRPT